MPEETERTSIWVWVLMAAIIAIIAFGAYSTIRRDHAPVDAPTPYLQCVHECTSAISTPARETDCIQGCAGLIECPKTPN